MIHLTSLCNSVPGSDVGQWNLTAANVAEQQRNGAICQNEHSAFFYTAKSVFLMGSETSLKKKKRNKMKKRKMKKNEMKGIKMKCLALVVVLSTKKQCKQKSEHYCFFPSLQILIPTPGLYTFTVLGWQAQLEWLGRHLGRWPLQMQWLNLTETINQRFYFGFSHLIFLQLTNKKTGSKIMNALTINYFWSLNYGI